MLPVLWNYRQLHTRRRLSSLLCRKARMSLAKVVPMKHATRWKSIAQRLFPVVANRSSAASTLARETFTHGLVDLFSRSFVALEQLQRLPKRVRVCCVVLLPPSGYVPPLSVSPVSGHYVHISRKSHLSPCFILKILDNLCRNRHTKPYLHEEECSRNVLPEGCDVACLFTITRDC
jgi:hypothetical protein